MGKISVRKQEPVADQGPSQEDIDWLNMPAVGREFGSADFDRLTALDEAAFAAFQSWEEVRHWLVTPNAQLGGACPEDFARGSVGYDKVMALLMFAGKPASADFMQGVERPPVQERDALNSFMGVDESRATSESPSNQKIAKANRRPRAG